MKQNINKQIRNYLVLVFIIAWSSEALIIIGETSGLLQGKIGIIIIYLIIISGAGLTPVYVSAILLYRQKRFTNIRSFFRLIIRTSNYRTTIWVTPVFALALFLINLINESYSGNPYYYFILYLPLMIFGGGLEEVGWRGYLQPLLEQRFSFFITNFVIGVLWGVWHSPLWLIQSANQSSMNFLSFFVYCISFSFILGLLYKVTQSTLACIILHAWGNTLQGMFTMGYLKEPLDLKISVIWIWVILIVITIYSFIKKSKREIESPSKS